MDKVTSRRLVAFIAIATPLALPQGHAVAQQIVANGTGETKTATGTIDTGVTLPTAGYGLYALNGGIILGTSTLQVFTGGVEADGVRAESGGSITLAAGTSVIASGTASFGLFAAGGLGSFPPSPRQGQQLSPAEALASQASPAV